MLSCGNGAVTSAGNYQTKRIEDRRSVLLHCVLILLMLLNPLRAIKQRNGLAADWLSKVTGVQWRDEYRLLQSPLQQWQVTLKNTCWTLWTAWYLCSDIWCKPSFAVYDFKEAVSQLPVLIEAVHDLWELRTILSVKVLGPDSILHTSPILKLACTKPAGAAHISSHHGSLKNLTNLEAQSTD